MFYGRGMTAMLHVVYGPSGAGKSTYAKELARREPAVHFAIDDWMARLFAADMPEPIEYHWMMERVERCEAQIWSTAAGVIAAGTSVAARLLGDDRVGRISEGGLADLVVVDGDLRTADVRGVENRVNAVYLDGELV